MVILYSKKDVFTRAYMGEVIPVTYSEKHEFYFMIQFPS